MAHACNSGYWGSGNRFETSPGKVSVRSYLKNKLETRGMAQVIEYLPTKSKARISIPKAANKQKQKIKAMN
jgi:hypothetical protein